MGKYSTMSEDLVDIEVDLPIETIEWLEEQADKLNVDLNTYVVNILKGHLETNEDT